MEKLHTKEVDTLFEAILKLETLEECYKFFEDACTIKEILDIAQRLKAAKMLTNGENYIEVSKATGMSTATISRVNKCLSYGGGGYKMILDRLDNSKGEDK
jgi:TrpR-related protein YerC/YecD